MTPQWSGGLEERERRGERGGRRGEGEIEREREMKWEEGVR